MQIKRFEADDMTEALRLVKRELGDDAVILSAQETRTKGFFSALKKKRVEITAAADYPPEVLSQGQEFPEMLSAQLDRDTPVDQVSLSIRPRPVRQSQPLQTSADLGGDSPGYSAPGQRSVPGHTVRHLDRGTPAEHNRPGNDADARHDAAEPGICAEPSLTTPTGATPSKQWIAKPFYNTSSDRRKVIALVGPSGAGKSASVAKLARHCRVAENMSVALFSLDRFRIGANAMLDRVARTMDLPFTVIRDAKQLHSRLDELGDVDVVLIDTPGVNGKESSLMAEINALISESGASEIHLVINATVRENLLADLADRFIPLGVNRLLFTHLDEYGRDMSIANILSRTGLPVSFYTSGTDLFDHLHEGSRERLAAFLPADHDSRQRVMPFPRNPLSTREGKIRATGDVGHNEVQYVANRNSELFHLPTCKSVKRINVKNIAAFASAEQAIDAGFKPCRACCRTSLTGHSKKVALAAL